MFSSLVLPEISRVEAQLRNSLFTALPWRRKSLADGRQTYIRFGPEIPLVHPDFQFTLLAGKQPLFLQVQLAPASPWWKKFHEETDLEALPDPFRKALVGAFISDVIDTIQASFETEIRMTDDEEISRDEALVGFGWTVLGEKNETLSCGTLRITPLLAATLTRSSRKWLRPDPPEWPGLLLEGSLYLERFHTPFSTLRGLEAGDAFFLRTPPEKLQTIEVVFSPARVLAGAFPRSHLESLLIACPQMSDDLAPPPASSQDNSAQPIRWMDDIDVEIAFRVGTLRMPIAQLSGLTEGQVIELDQPATPTIEILVNQQVIGRGSLVRVGEKLAVCVQEVRRSNHEL